MHLALADRRVPMSAVGGGWFLADGPGADDGTDYAFVLDDRRPLPDPRSPWQPNGVHGPSRLVDHGRFTWSDAGWQPPALETGLIYELHVGTFTPEGTFDAAIPRLDHLVRLGVTHVELMPVAEFPGRWGWGYDGVDLYAARHAYGGPHGLARFVDACHARGLAVLLDVVYNHLGPSGSHLAAFGPYFTDRHHTPWGQAMNLDGPESDEVRRFICDNASMWLERYHVDGLRIDAVHAIVDTSATHILEQLAGEIHALAARLGRPLVLVAESDLNDPRIVRSPDEGGYGLDAQWNEDFHHALYALLTGERAGYYGDFGTLADLAGVLVRGFVYDGRYSTYRRRRHGRPARGLSGHRFVGFLQDHDQVGNRPRGERTSHVLPPDLLRVGAALVFTAPFVPMLFQGEEWGASAPFAYFADHEDPALARAVRYARRRELAAFGWDVSGMFDPGSVDTFRRCVLDWTERERAPHDGLLEWHRRLARLRRECADLHDGDMAQTHARFDDQNRWLVVERGPVTVACNLSPWPRTVPVRTDGSAIALASREGVTCSASGVELPARSVAILAPARSAP